jgi:outer membrane protein OmpA-like peptidoglycan-associated protein
MKLVPVIVSALCLALAPAVGRTQPVDTEIAGVTAELVELRRAGGLVRLAVRFTNSSATMQDSTRYRADRIVLVDAKSKRKHLPLKDANGQFLAGPFGDLIEGGRIRLMVPPKMSTVVWAYFDAVAAGTVMNVEMPTVFPFDKVPIAEGPSTILASTTARSTPGGVIATLVSASRADQVLNVRLRFAAEPGATVHMASPYFYFKDVFLFDPQSKRKYPLLKDTEGNFQAQPMQVKMDGGAFIPDWSKTSLVSLTFQAPPDTVQSADLILPHFLPFESVAIEGLGGAGAGGIAVAGKSLGLEGVLKDLKAEVTPTEIRIDLAADVLFDFDKSTLKKEAEPSLMNVATVLKANPTAAVAIEGHTDGKGVDAYNQALSEQRAASVKRWLVANAQVNGANIATRGWGKTKPVAHNTKPDGSDDPEGRAKNRRVQIVVRKG